MSQLALQFPVQYLALRPELMQLMRELVEAEQTVSSIHRVLYVYSERFERNEQLERCHLACLDFLLADVDLNTAVSPSLFYCLFVDFNLTSYLLHSSCRRTLRLSWPYGLLLPIFLMRRGSMTTGHS